MLKLLDDKSQKTLLPELDFESMPPTALGVSATRYVHVGLKNTLLPNGPWHFVIAQNSRAFVNLKKTWMIVKFKITDEKGSPIKPKMKKDDATGIEFDEEPQYAVCQNFAASLIRSFQLHINGVQVYDSTVNHAYKAYLETALMNSKEYKESAAQLSGFSFESSLNSETDPGFLFRQTLVKEGRICELAAPISIDLFNQERLMLNYATIELTAYPNKDSFLVDSYAAKSTSRQYQVRVQDVHLLVQEWDMNDGICAAIETKLQKAPIHYPMTSVQMRSFFIAADRMDSPSNIIFSSHCPKRLVVGLVDSNSFNGTVSQSPFNFKHFGLHNIFIDLNGRTIPNRPMALNWTDDSYISAYLQMIEGCGYARTNQSNGITPDMFKNGFAFFVFDISPTVHNPDMFDVCTQSNVSLRLEFKDKIPANGIYAVIYAEFDTVMSLDYTRNPTIATIL